MKSKFLVAQGSLTDGGALLLVNAANTNVNLGSGVSGAIRAACGRGYQDRIHAALQERYGGPMEPGQVLITDAGAHPIARWVAHVAVMDYRQGFSARSFPTPERLERCYVNLWRAIETIEEADEISIAAVALGAGTGNVGLRNSVERACATLVEHLEQTERSRIGDVTFYGYELPEYLVTLEVVRSFFEVDASSVSDAAREFLATGDD
ncbi:MAG: macro domain-containing protein [Deltaproteobacteria bacterium]|nr:macro domain-containing protein [Deltaproteobacteria bacterium]